MSSCLCDQCAALCCRYFALPIDNPTSRKDIDDIRWYLIHEHVVVFIEKKQWHVGIMTKCKHLQPDNRCGIYDTRPRICRKYTTDNCDWHGGEYDFDKLFLSADQLMAYADEYLEKLKRKQRKAKVLQRRRRKRRVLPVAAPAPEVKPAVQLTIKGRLPDRNRNGVSFALSR
jgi:uncharacterized protein